MVLYTKLICSRTPLTTNSTYTKLPSNNDQLYDSQDPDNTSFTIPSVILLCMLNLTINSTLPSYSPSRSYNKDTLTYKYCSIVKVEHPNTNIVEHHDTGGVVHQSRGTTSYMTHIRQIRNSTSKQPKYKQSKAY